MMERSGGLIEQEARLGRRRASLQREEFDSSPRHLRENLRVLDEVLEATNSDVRRRVRLTFGELVANWQLRFSGERICVVMEFLPNAVRMNVHHPERSLAADEWDGLISPVVVSLVDDCGADRRVAGSAWFEFRARKLRSRAPRPRADWTYSGHAYRVGSRVWFDS